MEFFTKVGPVLLGFMALGLYLFLLGCNAKLPPKVFQGKVSILVLSILLLLWTGSNTVMRATSPSRGELVLEDIVKQVHPPAQVNDTTRIESVTLEGETIIYTIAFSTSQAEAQVLSDDMKKAIAVEACRESAFGVALKLNVPVEVRFKDSANTPMEPLHITPADCPTQPPK